MVVVAVVAGLQKKFSSKNVAKKEIWMMTWLVAKKRVGQKPNFEIPAAKKNLVQKTVAIKVWI